MSASSLVWTIATIAIAYIIVTKVNLGNLLGGSGGGMANAQPPPATTTGKPVKPRPGRNNRTSGT